MSIKKIILIVSVVFYISSCALTGPTVKEQVDAACKDSEYSAILTSIRICGVDSNTLTAQLEEACKGEYAYVLKQLNFCS